MASDCGGGGGGYGGIAADMSPEGLKKLVRNLRDAVNKNLSDADILAVLEECDMDLDAAVQRLLFQDTFQQVKSKRERRKEIKEKQELQAWIKNDEAINSCRVGSEDASVRGGSTRNDFSDLGKAAYERESGSAAPLLRPSSMSEALGQISKLSKDSVDKSHHSVGKGDNFSLPFQQTSVSRPNWDRLTSGHVSMADSVIMGTSSDKSLHVASEATHLPQDTVDPNSLQLNAGPLLDVTLHRRQIHENVDSYLTSGMLGNTVAGCGFNDEQPIPEQMIATSRASLLDSPDTFNQSDMYNVPDLLKPSQSYESQEARDDVSGEDLCFDSRSASDSGRQTSANGTRGASTGDVPFLVDKKHRNDYRLMNESLAGFQHLSLGESEEATSPVENQCSVVLPDHSQNLVADCSHLTFGTYRSGNRSFLVPGTLAPASEDCSSSVHLGSGNKSLPTDSIAWRNHTSLSRELEHQISVSADLQTSDLQSSNARYPASLTAAEIPTAPRVLESDAFSLLQSSATRAFRGASSGARSAPRQPSSGNSYPGFHDLSMRPDHASLESAWRMRTNNSLFHQDINSFSNPVVGPHYRASQQFRSHDPVNSFHLSRPVVSVNGAYGSSTSIPGSLIQNVPAVTPVAQARYGGFLLSQYGNRNNFALNQGNDSAGWGFSGLGSRTTSGAPDRQAYSLARQNQRYAGYQQNLPLLRGYPTLGDPTGHNSQPGSAQSELGDGLFNSDPSRFQQDLSQPSGRFGNFLL